MFITSNALNNLGSFLKINLYDSVDSTGKNKIIYFHSVPTEVIGYVIGTI